MPEPGAVVDPRSLTADKILTYARLALLATDRNDPVRAAKYRSEAQALCPELQWTSCTTDRLTDMVRQLDEHSMGNLKPATAQGHGS
jgi:hypothetical protein